MRETNFINQNREKWEEFEKALEQNTQNPEQLNRLFIEIMDDTSYARTFYPNRSVRVYLNNLAQQIFFKVYGSRQTRLNRFVHFWTDELPRLIYESRIAFRVAFGVFILSMLIGAFSSQMDPEFPRVILGDSYVEMTIENIESGDPMAVYKDKGRFGMSLGITANNLFVAFLTFVLGALFCVGTIAVLLQNGVMVGSFQHFFYDKGVFQESFLTIWTHGTLEISAIIIAGAAGLTMGQGLVFPGTLSRMQAFQISARRGLKIMLGLVPVFIAAGFIEGYLTRFTDTPDAVRLMFILICLFFILGYFVWYPIKKAREGFSKNVKDTQIPPDELYEINYSKIKTSGEIVADTIAFIKKHLSLFIRSSAIVAGLYTILSYLLTNGVLADHFDFQLEPMGSLFNISIFFYTEDMLFLPVINIILYTGLCLFFYLFFIRNYQLKNGIEPVKFSLKEQLFFVGNTLIGVGLFCGGMMINIPAVRFLLLLILPLIFLGLFISFHERTHFFKAISRSFSLKGYTTIANIWLIFVVLGFLLFFLMDTSILWFYLQFLGWNFTSSQETLDFMLLATLVFMAVFILSFLAMIFMTGCSLLYFSLSEIQEAGWLKSAIKNIGNYRVIQGMEREG